MRNVASVSGVIVTVIRIMVASGQLVRLLSVFSLPVFFMFSHQSPIIAARHAPLLLSPGMCCPVFLVLIVRAAP